MALCVCWGWGLGFGVRVTATEIGMTAGDVGWPHVPSSRVRVRVRVGDAGWPHVPGSRCGLHQAPSNPQGARWQRYRWLSLPDD